MVAIPTSIAARKKSKAIPKALIYETIDGVHYYYKGYKNVIKNNLKAESVMGYGLFQWMLVNIITNYLNQNISKSFLALGGEGGFHLGLNNNLSLDVVVLERKDLDFSKIQNKYLDFSPKVVIEIDTKAEIANDMEDVYYYRKTQKMLDFGVSQVVWIFTNTKKIMVAETDKAWLTVNWSDEIEILSVKIKLNELLKNEGFDF